jgi:hypothetical protein
MEGKYGAALTAPVCHKGVLAMESELARLIAQIPAEDLSESDPSYEPKVWQGKIHRARPRVAATSAPPRFEDPYRQLADVFGGRPPRDRLFDDRDMGPTSERTL